MNGNKSDEVNVRIYDRSEHGIGDAPIDVDVLKIIGRLQRKGHAAYIVGGAIRDLLLGIVPKDYDIATDAIPAHIRKLFSNCRIIGKRFRLIHVYFANNKIIEVATFRSNHDVNAYGRIEQDAQRRDFTLNALYYDTADKYLIDYVGGYRDIRDGKVVPVIPTDAIFKEDPVRMVRAVKYSVGTGLTIVRPLARAMRRDAHLLNATSHSRLTEEFIKIISSGNAAGVFTMLYDYRLLPYMQPQLDTRFQDKRSRAYIAAMLSKLDAAATKTKGLYKQMSAYLALFSFDLKETTPGQRLMMAKSMIAPITPPNSVVSEAMEYLYDQHYEQRQKSRGSTRATNSEGNARATSSGGRRRRGGRRRG